MKKIRSAVYFPALLATLILCLAACSSYKSHYNAIALVQTNTSGKASMSFSVFEGSNVFELKSGADGKVIDYSAKLGTGSAKVWYDAGEGKTLLFEIGPGIEVEGQSADLPKGKVSIIVETTEKCGDGSFSFKID